MRQAFTPPGLSAGAPLMQLRVGMAPIQIVKIGHAVVVRGGRAVVIKLRQILH
ncbi:hypothetical protein D3C73_1630680 [compost metagenome]